jgi:membrane fusion protein, copper/silver efflux system
MKKLLLIAFVFALGYGYGRWYAKGPLPVSASSIPAAKKILYYQDPMHPDYKSDKPGKAPDCGMDLEPVYEEVQALHEPESTVFISPEKQQLIGVQYGTVGYGAAFQTLRAPAKVGVDETRLSRVTTKIEGWVDGLDVKLVGAQVKRGQQMLTIVNPQWQQQYKALLRSKVLRASDQEDNALTAARERIRAVGYSEEDVEMINRARLQNWKLPVYSPMDGVVLERNVLAGQKLTPDTLFTIGDLSSLWVTADFQENDAAAIHVGQSAAFTVPSLPGKVFHGTVNSILPQLDPVSRTLKVRMQFANPGLALRPEMYGTVELRTGGSRRLSVAQEAILNSGSKQIVFVDRGNGYLEQRAVQAGRGFDGRVEVLSGLKAGERVVTSANFLIDSESQLRSISHGNASHGQ